MGAGEVTVWLAADAVHLAREWFNLRGSNDIETRHSSWWIWEEDVRPVCAKGSLDGLG